MMWPPRPPSPPSGPPLGTNFSFRKLTFPSPPLPAFSSIVTSSTMLAVFWMAKLVTASSQTFCPQRLTLSNSARGSGRDRGLSTPSSPSAMVPSADGTAPSNGRVTLAGRWLRTYTRAPQPKVASTNKTSSSWICGGCSTEAATPATTKDRQSASGAGGWMAAALSWDTDMALVSARACVATGARKPLSRVGCAFTNGVLKLAELANTVGPDVVVNNVKLMATHPIPNAASARNSLHL
mmetsp:Transcript_27087/g.45992  ORF Transcript_27087/g.45992 Transcript_27087/m.45992 type:complete len:238 (+) Transcript_27087:1460-2173(+)